MQICIHNRFSIHGKSLRSQEGRFLGMPQGARLCRGCWKIAGDLSLYPHHLLINTKAEQQKLLNNKWSEITFYPLLKDKTVLFFHNLVHRYIPPLSERTSMSLKLSMWHWVHCICYEVVIWLFPPRIERVFSTESRTRTTEIKILILYSTANWNGTQCGHQSSLLSPRTYLSNESLILILPRVTSHRVCSTWRIIPFSKWITNI